MKLVYDDKDQKYIDTIIESFEKNENIPIFLPKGRQGTTISLKFEILDVPKANAFVGTFMSDESVQHLAEVAGVKTLELGYIPTDQREDILAILDEAKQRITDLLNK